MGERALRLPPVLSADQLGRLHEEAVGILKRVGIKVPQADLRQSLASKAGVHLQGDRARLEPNLVQEMVDEHRQRMAAQPQAMSAEGNRPAYLKRGQTIWLQAGSHARWWHDRRTDQIRPSSLADMVVAAKLIYGLRERCVAGTTSGTASDLPEPLRPIAQMYVALRYAGGRVYAAVQSPEQMAAVLDLYEAAERGCHWSVHLISPLRLEGNELDIVRALRGRLASVCVGSMPMCGASAPLFIPGGLVVAIAEVVGGYTLMRLLWPELSLSFSIGLLCMDMRRGGMVYSSPESNLADLARREVNRFYGITDGATRSIRSMAKKPGVQASAERAAGAVVGALAGSRAFAGAGLLSLDEVFSPLQLVIDCEIRDWAQRFAAGFDFDEQSLSLDLIDEVVSTTGEFLSHEQTLRNYRQMYWMPSLFEYGMLGPWLAGQTRDLLEAASEKVDRAIASYDYSPPEPLGRRIDAAYERICKQFRG